MRYLILFLLFFSAQALGDRPVHILVLNQGDTVYEGDTIYEGDTVVEGDTITTANERSMNQAVAIAMSAGACQFDYAPGLQGCVSTSTFSDEWAVNFGVGKRVDDLLFNGGFACDTDFNECGAVGAVNWHF